MSISLIKFKLPQRNKVPAITLDNFTPPGAKEFGRGPGKYPRPPPDNSFSSLQCCSRALTAVA
jgi:hypothetical protein